MKFGSGCFLYKLHCCTAKCMRTLNALRLFFLRQMLYACQSHLGVRTERSTFGSPMIFNKKRRFRLQTKLSCARCAPFHAANARFVDFFRTKQRIIEIA